MGAFISVLMSTIFGFFAQYFTRKISSVLMWVTFITALWALLLAAKVALVAGLSYVPLANQIIPYVSCGIPSNAIPCVSIVLVARAVMSGYNYLREIGKPFLAG